MIWHHAIGHHHQTATRSKLACRSIDGLIKLLSKQIDELEAAIARLIQSDDDWKHKADLVDYQRLIQKGKLYKSIQW